MVVGYYVLHTLSRRWPWDHRRCSCGLMWGGGGKIKLFLTWETCNTEHCVIQKAYSIFFLRVPNNVCLHVWMIIGCCVPDIHKHTHTHTHTHTHMHKLWSPVLSINTHTHTHKRFSTPTSDPSNVCRAPVHILWVVVKRVLQRRRGPHHVSTRRVHNALGLASGAAAWLFYKKRKRSLKICRYRERERERER